MTTYQGLYLIPRDETVPNLGVNQIGFSLDLPSLILPDGWKCHVWAGNRGLKIWVHKEHTSLLDFAPFGGFWMVGLWGDIQPETGRDDNDIEDTIVRAIRRLIVPVIEQQS